MGENSDYANNLHKLCSNINRITGKMGDSSPTPRRLFSGFICSVVFYNLER